VLYVGVAIAALRLLGTGVLAGSDQPLAAVVRAAVGSQAADVVALVTLIATVNTTLLSLTAASRLTYGMGTTGALPGQLSVLSIRRVPAGAFIVTVAYAAGLSVIGNVAFMVSVTDVSVFLVFIAVNLTVIGLRVRRPHRLRPFRVPWTLGRVPLPSIAALGTVALLLPSVHLSALLAGALLCLLGGLVYVAMRTGTGTGVPPSATLEGVRRRHVTRQEAEETATRPRVDFAVVAFDVDELWRA
jgi:APA family basic amino acid/polyamine antiporter